MELFSKEQKVEENQGMKSFPINFNEIPLFNELLIAVLVIIQLFT